MQESNGTFESLRRRIAQFNDKTISITVECLPDLKQLLLDCRMADLDNTDNPLQHEFWMAMESRGIELDAYGNYQRGIPGLRASMISPRILKE